MFVENKQFMLKVICFICVSNYISKYFKLISSLCKPSLVKSIAYVVTPVFMNSTTMFYSISVSSMQGNSNISRGTKLFIIFTCSIQSLSLQFDTHMKHITFNMSFLFSVNMNPKHLEQCQFNQQVQVDLALSFAYFFVGAF